MHLLMAALLGGAGSAHASEADDLPRLRLSVRGGYTNYSRMHFVTGELEGAVRVLAGLHVVAGGALYGLPLTPPPQRQLDNGRLQEWAALAPVHLGARYQIAVTDWLHPFVGADALTVRYYQGADGGAWAGGGRLRLGADAMFGEHLGANVNLGVGVWSGKRWPDLLVGLPQTGPVPQIGGGLTWAM